MSNNPYADAVLADSPTRYWRLNETSGTTAADSGSGSVNGTYFGPTLDQGSPTNDVDASSALFDGSDDYVDTNGTTPVRPNTGEPWSIELFFYLTSISNNSGRAMLSNGTASNSNDQITLMAYKAGHLSYNELRVQLNGTSNADVFRNIVGSWQHVVITWDGSTAKAYRNGSYVKDLNVGTSTDTTRNVLIGKRHSDAPFLGNIAEVAIYDTALSAARILAHYEAASEEVGSEPIEEAISLSSGHGLAPAPVAQASAAVALELAMGATLAGARTTAAALTLEIHQAATADAVAGGQGRVTLAHAAGLAPAAQAAGAAAIELITALADAYSRGSAVEASLALAIGHGLGVAGSRTAEVALALEQRLAAAATATAGAHGQLTLAHRQAAATLAAAIVAADLTIEHVAAVGVSSSSISADLVTPARRTVRVRLQTREIDVPRRDRSTRPKGLR